MTWKRNSNVLFACRWLRVPATTEIDSLAGHDRRSWLEVMVAENVVVAVGDIATLTTNLEPHWQLLRDTYERDAALRVPPVVLSFPGGAPIEVAVPT